MRFKYYNTYKDTQGNAISGGSVVVKTDAGALATIYSTETGGSPIANSVVTTDASGAFSFWVDTIDYSLTQQFNITASKLNYVSSTISDVTIFPSLQYRYIADPSESDQGIVGGGNTIKNLVDKIGSSVETIYLPPGDYTLTTSETIPSNITLKFAAGAVIDGVGTLTINGEIKATPAQKIFDSSLAVAGPFKDNIDYPEWHGAVADGSTDDTTSIHAARDTDNETIKFTKGTYITTGITANNAGQSWVLDDSAIIKLADSSDANVFTFSAENNIISGGKIDGNRANQTAGNGIAINSVAGTKVDNIYVTGCYTYGIYGNTVGAKTKIHNNRVDDTGNIAIFIQSTTTADITDLEVIGNHVDRSTEGAGISGGGIQIRSNGATGGNVYRVKVIENTVLTQPNPTGNSIPIELWNASHSVVKGNICVGGSIGISLARSTSSTVTANTITGQKTYSIELSVISKYNTVSANIIDGNALTPIGIINSNVTDQSDHNVYTGNNIYNLAATGIVRGIQIAGGDYITVSNNVIDIELGYAINLISSFYWSVANNVGRGNSGATKFCFLNESWFGIVSGNSATGFTEDNVYLFGDGAVTFAEIAITGNQFGVTTLLNDSLSGGAVLGQKITGFGNTGPSYNDQYMDYANNVKIVERNGTPESVVTAGPGSICLNRAGGAGVSFYIKESGTGNTGWVAK